MAKRLIMDCKSFSFVVGFSIGVLDRTRARYLNVISALDFHLAGRDSQAVGIALG